LSKEKLKLIKNKIPIPRLGYFRDDDGGGGNSLNQALRKKSYEEIINKILSNKIIKEKNKMKNILQKLNSGVDKILKVLYVYATSLPVVNSPTATSIATTGAVLGANVSSLGDPASVSEKGICYGLSSSPTNCVKAFSVEALVVAGGGGGHNGLYGGGGGGGGILYNPSLNVSAQSYAVTVGNGGNSNANGENSIFSNLTAIGGGAGGEYGGVHEYGYPGGSGGGGAGTQNFSSAGGIGTPGQGSDGEVGYSKYSSGDGSIHAGSGGSYQEPLSGTFVQGGGYCSGINNTGPYCPAAIDALPNTGNGGQGQGYISFNTSGVGGKGGSGYVKISYLTNGGITATGGTITYSGGKTIHTFTTGGNFVVSSASQISTGIYTQSISGLNPNTTYYYRGYATNSTGTSYSADSTFTTLATPTVTTPTVTGITTASAIVGANVTNLGNPASISARGICYGLTASPTYCVAEGGTTTGVFTQTVTGIAGTTYYYRGYATNTSGTAYSVDSTFTTLATPTITTPTATNITTTTATIGANVTSLGVPASISTRGTCWGTSATPTTNCVAQGGTTTGVFTQNITGLTSGVTYYYRGYATNSSGTVYSADSTFATMGVPTLTTPTVASIAETTATLGANVTTAGGYASVTARGTCWGTSPSPTTNCLAEGGTTTGVFTQARTGFTAGTTYYFRGYATNALGTAYSVDRTFKYDTAWSSCVLGASNGTYTLNPDPILSSTGYNSPSADVEEFLYKPLNGDGYVIVKVNTISGSGWGHIMMQENCTAGSKKVALKTQLQTMIRSEIRNTTGGATVSTQISRMGAKWFKIQRVGNRFDAYTSSDGVGWMSAFSTTMTLPSTILVGIASEAINNTSTTVVSFNNYSMTDQVAPTVNLTYSNNPTGAGTQTITATYSEAFVGTPTISINQPGTTDISNAAMSGSGLVWTYYYTVKASTGNTYVDGTATVSLSSVTDAAGNVSAAPTNNTFVINTTPPSVALTYTANTVSAGIQTITATYSEAIVGTPTISINQPGSTDISNAAMSGSGKVWTYAYTVYASTGNTYVDGTATVSLSTMVDLGGSNSLAPTNNTFVIKTVGPTVNLTYTKKIIGTGTQTITATYTEALVGAPAISIDQPGSIDITNATMSGSGKVWTYDYTVYMANGTTYVDGVATVTTSSVTDDLGNVSNSVPTNNTFTINTTGPSVVLSYSANTIGSGVQKITATYSGAVLGSPTISINQPGTTDVLNMAMSGTGSIRTYDYVVNKANGTTYVDGTATVSLSPVVDLAGNPTNAPSNIKFIINTTGPTVALTYGSNPASVGADLITATYSTSIVGTPTISINQPGTTDILNAVMSGGGSVWTYSYVVNPTDGSNYLDGNAIVSLSSVVDAGGIPSNAPTNNILVLNTAGPTVDLTYSSNPAGVGTNTITATYSKTIVGEPTISINQPGTIDITNAAMIGNGLTRTYTYTVHLANGTTYKDGIATVGLTLVTDSSGSVSSMPTNNTFTINTAGPTVALSYTSNSVGVGVTQRINAKYSKPINGIPNVSIDQQGTTDVLNTPMIAPASVWQAKTGVETNAWTSITYGNGTFVAVAVEGKVMTSTDGTTWVERTPAETNTWTSVTYGNGTFVAVSQNGRAMTSTNGTTWVARTPVNFYQWNSVTYGNGMFVAVASNGTKRVMTSTDGITWAEGEMTTSNTWTSVAYGNGTFVAVAYDGTKRVVTSTNGTIWTERNAGGSNTWTSVVYGNGTFVAVADDGGVMTSPDGINWIMRTAAQLNAWKSVNYNSNIFVAVSSTGTNRVMTSSDGVVWTSQTASSSNSWQSITYGNNLFVAVSSDGTNQVMTSADGYYYDYLVMPADGTNYIDGLVTVSLSTVTDLLGVSSGAPTNNTFLIQNGFSPAGTLTSSVFDTTSASTNIKYNSIMWKGTLGGDNANEGKVRFQLATSATPTGPWNYYGGATCGAQDWFDPMGPNNPVELKGADCLAAWNGLRYFRYKVQICSSSDCISLGTSTPTVNSVVVNWSP